MTLRLNFQLFSQLWLALGFSLALIGLPFLQPSFTDMPSGQAFAQEARLVVQGSGLPVPRFVTLKSDEVNMRKGPGREYPVAWVYQRRGMPLKVIAEYDVWRKVEDPDGTIGWIHSPLLSLKRNAMLTERVTKIYRKADESAEVAAVAERGVVMELQLCEADWCRIANDQLRGWVRRDQIWGLLKDEKLD